MQQKRLIDIPVQHKMDEVADAAQAAGYPFSGIDMQFLSVIGQNITWLNHSGEYLGKKYNRGVPIGRPLLMIGWEEEFNNRGTDDSIDGTQPIIDFFHRYHDERKNIIKAGLEGTGENNKCIYEIAAVRLGIFNMLKERYNFRQQFNEDGINLVRYTEHFHYSLWATDRQSHPLSLFETLPAKFRKDAGQGVLGVMCEAIPLISTYDQIEGRVNGRITKAKIAVEVEHSKECFMRISDPRFDRGITNWHYEMRRTFRGDDSPSVRLFDPCLAALAVMTSGIVYGLEGIDKQTPKPDETYIGPGRYQEHLDRMLSSPIIQSFFPKKLLTNLAGILQVKSGQNDPALRGSKGVGEFVIV
jgi:hypothetical protein